MTTKRLLVSIFTLGLVALICWPNANSQERNDRDNNRRGDRRSDFRRPPGPPGGGGGGSTVLMKFDGDHIYLFSHGTLYKIAKSTMKVEGKVSIRPQRPRRGQQDGDQRMRRRPPQDDWGLPRDDERGPRRRQQRDRQDEAK